MEEFERNCTNDLSFFFKTMSEKITTFKDGIGLNESELKKFDEMDGAKDNQIFFKKNKSLIQGPKRILFKEYSQDLNHYFESFDFLKKMAKSKTGKDLKEEKNEINNKIFIIAENLDNSKDLTEDEFDFLIEKFENRFRQYKKYKENNGLEFQNYKKVGEEYDDRYYYIQKFLEYFKKIKVEDKCLTKKNFDYFHKIIKKILELNTNEDIDFELCHYVIFLSSKYYIIDESKKSGKQYLNEAIKDCPIMKKQGFWVGITKFELDKELNPKKIEKEFLGNKDITDEKINKDTIICLISVVENLMKNINDSKLFNEVVYKIFKFYNISKEKRVIIINRVQLKITSEDIINNIIDKDVIFSEY